MIKELRAQIKQLEEAALTPAQIEIIKKMFGRSISTPPMLGLMGRTITAEEIKQLKEAGIADEQIEVIKKLFEVMPWSISIPPIHPAFAALMQPSLTEAQILAPD